MNDYTTPPQSQQIHHKIISRIRKMLRLANDAGATEGERDNALRMAHATLAKYNLDLAVLEEAEPEKQSDEPRTEEEIRFSADPWARQVAVSVARLFMCSMWYRRHPPRHYFIGRHSNAVSAGLMAQFLVKAISREARQYERDNFMLPGMARSFAWGASDKIRLRVDELLRSSAKQTSDVRTSSGTALVLADIYQREHQANRALMTQRHPDLVTRHSRVSSVDASAFDAGMTYGGRLSLGRQIAGKSA